jgi:hypothetical protein
MKRCKPRGSICVSAVGALRDCRRLLRRSAKAFHPQQQQLGLCAICLTGGFDRGPMLQGDRDFAQHFRRYCPAPLRSNFPARSAITLDVSFQKINPRISQGMLAMRPGAMPLALALVPPPSCLPRATGALLVHIPDVLCNRRRTAQLS